MRNWRRSRWRWWCRRRQTQWSHLSQTIRRVHDFKWQRIRYTVIHTFLQQSPPQINLKNYFTFAIATVKQLPVLKGQTQRKRRKTNKLQRYSNLLYFVAALKLSFRNKLIQPNFSRNKKRQLFFITSNYNSIFHIYLFIFLNLFEKNFLITQ